MIQKRVVEKIKTHILCSIDFSENRPVYEIIWKCVVELGRPQMIIWLIACWIP
jgi:glutamyl/glutaminyl-tRNA synthetase